jgi:DNA (cytosine-5)-methyltransferase 1
MEMDAPMSDLTHFSLFSGIGGIDLAAEWAGFRSVGQCEFADYPYSILQKHWPDVPKWRDVRHVTADSLHNAKIGKITLLSGGFPCQPHSLVGKRMASGDERDLWGEFARIIREAHPEWVLGENVPGLLSSENGRFFGRILRDLAELGYDASWGVLSAFSAGGCHLRKRCFLVAHAVRKRMVQLDEMQKIRCACFPEENIHSVNPFNSHGLLLHALQEIRDGNSPIPRNDDGVPAALDRMKCLGNAVMPQQVYPVLVSIAHITRV